MNKPYLHLFIVIQAILFTGFGIILKDLDDALGDKLLWTGAATLAFFILKASYHLVIKSSREKETA